MEGRAGSAILRTSEGRVSVALQGVRGFFHAWEPPRSSVSAVYGVKCGGDVEVSGPGAIISNSNIKVSRAKRGDLYLKRCQA